MRTENGQTFFCALWRLRVANNPQHGSPPRQTHGFQQQRPAFFCRGKRSTARKQVEISVSQIIVSEELV